MGLDGNSICIVKVSPESITLEIPKRDLIARGKPRYTTRDGLDGHSGQQWRGGRKATWTPTSGRKSGTGPREVLLVDPRGTERSPLWKIKYKNKRGRLREPIVP